MNSRYGSFYGSNNQDSFNFASNPYNPCCMIASETAIFKSFSGQLRGIASSPGANFKKLTNAVHLYGRR